MVTKIVVPLDGSPLAERALPTAVALANRDAAQLCILRVVEQDMLYDNVISDDSRVKLSLATRYMQDVQHELTDSAEPFMIDPARLQNQTLYGPSIPTLLQVLAAEQPDLIVMTTHARVGVSRLALGSIANLITRHANVPTLLLHPNHTAPSSRDLAAGSILVTLDGTAESEAILAPAIALAKTLKTDIALLQVVAPAHSIPNFKGFAPYVHFKSDPETATTLKAADAYLNQIEMQVTAQGVRCSHSVRCAQAIIETITAEAIESGASVLAMATHARGRIGELVFGSVADAVLHTTNIPVLMIHANALVNAPAAAVPVA